MFHFGTAPINPRSYPIDHGFLVMLSSLAPIIVRRVAIAREIPHRCASQSPDQGEEYMDFDQWVTAHVAWKTKLKAYIAKPDHSLTPAEASQDNRCDLGKWIASEGAKHASLPEFQKLRTEHTRFHKAAADIIRRVDSRQNVSEDVALGAKSEFSSASAAVISAIIAVKNKIPVAVSVQR
jgi:methyl-accepting chemotaxis protein